MSLLGTTVGRIRIVDILGKGGMGEVFVGFDEKLERKVALKALREEFRLAEETKSRFLREARALSHLQHPNICLIHDYLETEESDFLVLELIEGQTLTEALKNGIPVRQKLEIAQQLAAVLVAAHGAGIVHRDLKPGNVMLTAEGLVKVLDFGLARSLTEEMAPTPFSESDAALGAGPLSGESGADDETLPGGGSHVQTSYVQTRLGTVLGTVGYMSPEQARGEAASPASDMYSLGLVLQELFTGERPYEPSASLEEQIRKASAAETKQVHGIDSDLAALITRLKSLQPGGRPSAQDTAEKLLLIQEKPQRRLRRRLVAAAFAVLLLIIGVVGYQAIRISKEVERANRQAAIAEAVNQFLNNDLLAAVSPEEQGRDVLMRDVLDAAAERIDAETATSEGRFAEQPLVEATIRYTLGETYYRLGIYEKSQPHLERALALRRSILGERDIETLTSMVMLALLERARGEVGRAAERLEAVVATTTEELGPDHELTLEAKSDLASVYYDAGRFEEAIELLVPQLDYRRASMGSDHPSTLSAINNLASLYLTVGRYEDALPLFREVLEARRRTLGDDHPTTLISINNLGLLYKRMGELALAEPLLRESLDRSRSVLGPEHPNTFTSVSNLARLLLDQGTLDEAESLITELLDTERRILGPGHPSTLGSEGLLSRVFRERGDLVAAEKLSSEILARAQASLPPGHRQLGTLYGHHGADLVRLERFAEAETELLRGYEILVASVGERHPSTTTVIRHLIELYEAWGREEKADEWRARLGPDSGQ